MNPAVSSAAPTTTGFYSQIRGLIFLVLELWARWSGLGLGSLAPEVSLPIVIYHMWIRDCPFCISVPLCLFLSVPLLPGWVNVASLNPWLLDFHSAHFSDGSG